LGKGAIIIDIKLKLNKNFVACLNKMEKKYGENFERINGFHNDNLSFTDFIDNFVDSKQVSDVSIDANANSSTKDINTLNSDMYKPHKKLLAYNKIFFEITKKYGLSTAEEWLESEWNGDYYLHNATTSSYIPYCYAYDLDQIVEKGLYFIDKFKSTPAKHLTTFNDHVLEFISWTANRSSGAVGLPSYLVYSYYYWNNDVKNNFFLKNPEYYREQCFQKFIYDLNQPYLRVTEAAFSNISIMDKNYLAELFGARQFPDGEFVIDHIDGIIEHQKVFMEVISNIREAQMMTFPVLTYSLLFQEGKFVDEEFARWCNKHNMKWFDSNFYVGNDVTTLSNCCRLLSNISKLNGFINSIGGTSLSVGSVQVNTTNLRRIALESNRDKSKYIELLSKRTHLSIKVLDVIRNIIKRNIEKGLLPNYTYGLVKMENQYNTLGITAMYEAVRDMGLIQQDELGSNSYTEEGLEFATSVLRTINNVKDSYNFNYSINVEAVPAERANSILCNKDNLLYPEQEKDFLYSNQWIPLMENSTIQEKIRLGAVLDKECGGGQILHVNLQGKFASEEQSWDMLNHLANSGIIYFAYNVQISVCEDGHGFFGSICPMCGKPIRDVFSRIIGYLVPTQSYSKERKQEFDKRKWFLLD